MMKLPKRILMLAAGFYQLSLAAQIMPCEGGKTYWVLNRDSVYYAIDIPGRATATENKQTILVDSDPLSCGIVLKNKYADAGGKNPDLKLMVKHMGLETDKASKQLKTKLKMQVQSAPISEDQEAMIWYYELPEGAEPGTKAHVNASLIIREHIITLSSPQFSSQNFESVKDFLMEMISKLKTQEDVSRICEN